MKRKGCITVILIVLLAVVILLWIAVDSFGDDDKLHVSRREAITIALTKMELTRRDVSDLKTELDWQGSGNYPCYYIYFTYRDAEEHDMRVRCAVDGETSEYLGVEPVE